MVTWSKPERPEWMDEETYAQVPGELAVARGKQRNIAGWVARRRAGTRTAEAAERAAAENDRGHEERSDG